MLKKENIWLWCHPAGSFTGNWGGKLDGSTITPGEALRDLGIDNGIMVRSGGKPEADDFPAAFEDLKLAQRLKWSIVGDSASATTPFRDLDTVLRLRQSFPNLDGVMLDDFFPQPPGMPKPRMTLPEMEQMRGILDRHGLDAWVVLYEHQIGQIDNAYFSYVDTINFWTWFGDRLDAIPANIERIRTVTDKPVALGLYLWDFGYGIPLTEQQMELQLTLAERLYEQKLITDAVFLASCMVDLDFAAVRCLRRYLDKLT